MKIIIIILSSLLIPVVFFGCGFGESDSKPQNDPAKTEDISEDINKAKEALDKVEKDTKKSRQGADKLKNLTPKQFGKKALQAIQDEDLETLKSMVSAAMAVNLDEDFISREKQEYMQTWDGTVRGVKYRKDKMTGQLHALIYYDDKESDTGENSDVILIHVLEKNGKYWHALGGPWGFEEITKSDFRSYADSPDKLK